MLRSLQLADGHTATTILLHSEDDLAAIPALLGLEPRPVLVLIGGAAAMPQRFADVAAGALRDEILPACRDVGAMVVDGGTTAGVMGIVGQVGGDLLLAGVIPEGIARSETGRRWLEPHHAFFILVPGQNWGNESRWLPQVGRSLAGGRSVAGVLLNGGEVAMRDAYHLVASGVRLLAVIGTGGVADSAGTDTSDYARLVRQRAHEVPIEGLRKLLVQELKGESYESRE